MNITFLIGNGFDLNIGLETTYSAFLNDYKIVHEKDSELIKYFKTKILNDTNMWSSAEKAFGVATKKFKEDGYNAEDFCICHEDFCLKLAKYLLNQEQRLHYTSLKEIITKGFADAIRNYKKGFREAETQIISGAESSFGGGFSFNFISFNYTAVLDLCFEMLRSKNGLIGTRSTRSGIIANQLGKVLHVHGTVDKDMVLGVNDISQIAEPSLFDGFDEEYLNELIKQKTNEINEENSDKKAFDLLKASDLIYIYGMSIGETDKLWWQRICELMKQKPSLHVIIHRYDAPEEGLIRREYRLFVNNVKKEFTVYSGLDETKKREIETRIHISGINLFSDLSSLVENPANQDNTEETLTVAS